MKRWINRKHLTHGFLFFTGSLLFFIAFVFAAGVVYHVQTDWAVTLFYFLAGWMTSVVIIIIQRYLDRHKNTHL